MRGAFEAALEGDLCRLQTLVNKDNVGTLKKEFGWTVLHECADKQHAHLVAWLVEEAGADVNERTNAGMTPLALAARTGESSDCVRVLLENGGDPSIGDCDMWQPVHFASYRGFLATCAALTENFPPVARHGTRSPLHLAAMSGHADCCALLISRGIAVDAEDESNRTSLYYAIRYGYSDLAEMLLSAGCKLSKVVLDASLPSIPQWVLVLIADRDARRAAAFGVLQLAKRRSSVIGGNGRDVLRLLARMILEWRKGAA